MRTDVSSSHAFDEIAAARSAPIPRRSGRWDNEGRVDPTPHGFRLSTSGAPFANRAPFSESQPIPQTQLLSGAALRPRGDGHALAITRALQLPRRRLTASALRLNLSRLYGWPMGTPTDASPPASRPAAHGAGPMRFATHLHRARLALSIPRRFIPAHPGRFSKLSASRFYVSAYARAPGFPSPQFR